MSKKSVLESILDSDKDVQTKMNVEIDNEIRKWLFSEENNICVSQGKRVMEKITYNDFELKEHIIYLKPGLELCIYGVKEFPPYIRFGYITRDLHIFGCDCKDMSHLLKLDNKGLKNIRCITIENCPNLISLPDIKHVQKCFILKVINCPKLKINCKELPKALIQVVFYNNKNEVSYDEVKRYCAESDFTTIKLKKEN